MLDATPYKLPQELGAAANEESRALARLSFRSAYGLCPQRFPTPTIRLILFVGCLPGLICEIRDDGAGSKWIVPSVSCWYAIRSLPSTTWSFPAVNGGSNSRSASASSVCRFSHRTFPSLAALTASPTALETSIPSKRKFLTASAAEGSAKPSADPAEFGAVAVAVPHHRVFVPIPLAHGVVASVRVRGELDVRARRGVRSGSLDEQEVSVDSPWVSFRLILLEDGTMTNPYPADFRERALRMLAEARPDHLSDFAAASHVAGRLGVNPETLRLWKKRADIDAGREPGTSSEAQIEIKRLKKQIAELEKANEILRSASVFFATELGRPSSR